jgi:predicted nucleotidyltransferase
VQVGVSVDLAHPIRSVIPTGLVGPVLQALTESSAPRSLTELHRRAGDGSLSGTRKVLERLVDQGLVTKEAAGYRLNPEHLAADVVVALASLHKVFAHRVRAWLEEREETVVAAGIFGSMARRDGTADSDIDLLVVVEDSSDGEGLRDDLAKAVHAWTGNEAQVLVLPRAQVAELRRRREPLIGSWERDLQMLVGQRSEVVG